MLSTSYLSPTPLILLARDVTRTGTLAEGSILACILTGTHRTMLYSARVTLAPGP